MAHQHFLSGGILSITAAKIFSTPKPVFPTHIDIFQFAAQQINNVIAYFFGIRTW
jgi:hypothetical protein